MQYNSAYNQYKQFLGTIKGPSIVMTTKSNVSKIKFSASNIIKNYQSIVNKQKNNSSLNSRKNSISSTSRKGNHSTSRSHGQLTQSNQTLFTQVGDSPKNSKKTLKRELIPKEASIRFNCYFIKTYKNEVLIGQQHVILVDGQKLRISEICQQLGMIAINTIETKIKVEVYQDKFSDILIKSKIKHIQSCQNLQRGLNFGQFSAFLHLLPSEDGKLELLDQYSNESNIKSIEESLSTFILYEDLSVEKILQTLRQGNYLKKSTVFKEQFKHILRNKRLEYDFKSNMLMDSPRELEEGKGLNKSLDQSCKEPLPQRIAMSILNSPNYGIKKIQMIRKAVTREVSGNKNFNSRPQSIKTTPQKQQIPMKQIVKINNKEIKISKKEFLKKSPQLNKGSRNSDKKLKAQKNQKPVQIECFTAKMVEEKPIVDLTPNNEYSIDLSKIFNGVNYTPIEGTTSTNINTKNDATNKSINFTNQAYAQISATNFLNASKKVKIEGGTTNIDKKQFFIDIKELSQLLDKVHNDNQ